MTSYEITRAQYLADPSGWMARIKPHGCLNIIGDDGKVRQRIVLPVPLPPCDDPACVAARERIAKLEAAMKEAHRALWASPENRLHAINVLGVVLSQGERIEAVPSEALADDESILSHGVMTENLRRLAAALGLREGKHTADSVARIAIERLVLAPSPSEVWRAAEKIVDAVENASPYSPLTFREAVAKALREFDAWKRSSEPAAAVSKVSAGDGGGSSGVKGVATPPPSAADVDEAYWIARTREARDKAGWYAWDRAREVLDAAAGDMPQPWRNAAIELLAEHHTGVVIADVLATLRAVRNMILDDVPNCESMLGRAIEKLEKLPHPPTHR